jgi:hypothetical protein
VSYTAEESYDVYKIVIRKARKPHTCDACKLPIERNHLYAVVHLVFDGSASSIKRCGACEVTHEHLRELCRYSGDYTWPDEKLNCGLDYEREWKQEPPFAITATAFMTTDERGALLTERGEVDV